MASFIKKIRGFNQKDLLDSVCDCYNSFAEDWDRTRKNNWSEFEIIKSKIKKGANVLDLGCGNGRLFKYLKDVTDVNYTGIDNSKKLINIAAQNFQDGNFEVGNVLNLPYEDSSFDTVISIAVAQHITPKSNRRIFFEEIHRVLKPNGTAFVTVWNIHQDKYKKYLKMYTKQKIIQTLKSPLNTSFGMGDCLIPYGEKKILRYIHAFTPDEISKLVSSNFTILDKLYTNKEGQVSNWKDARNICFYLRNN